MAFFDKIYTGKDQRPLTNREIKAFVMNARGISSQEYQKLYDRTRNKVRNYERYTGEEVGSVAKYLYKVELDKSMGRAEWQGRQKRLIESAPTLSTGASIEKVKKVYDPIIDAQVREDMKEFIASDPESAKAAGYDIKSKTFIKDDPNNPDPMRKYGKELKEFLEGRSDKVKAEKKTRKATTSSGDDAFDDTDIAFDYSEV